MATSSFKRNEKAASAAVDPLEAEQAKTVTNHEYADQQEKALATPPAALGGVAGEVRQQDLILPRLNLVQKTGELSDLFPVGSLVFNRDTVLTNGKDPLKIIVIRAVKQYQEKLPYGSEEMPKRFNTEAEVVAAGGTLSYEAARNGEGQLYTEILHTQVLIEQPEGLTEGDEHFFYTFGDKVYTLGAWSIGGGGYGSAGKILVTAQYTSHREGLHTGAWNLTTVKKVANDITFYLPILRPAGKLSPEQIEWVTSIAQ